MYKTKSEETKRNSNGPLEVKVTSTSNFKFPVCSKERKTIAYTTVKRDFFERVPSFYNSDVGFEKISILT